VKVARSEAALFVFSISFSFASCTVAEISGDSAWVTAKKRSEQRRRRNPNQLAERVRIIFNALQLQLSDEIHFDAGHTK
jgi:hypothetical protein